MIQYLRMYGTLALILLAVTLIIYASLIIYIASSSSNRNEFKCKSLTASVSALGVLWAAFSLVITLVPMGGEGGTLHVLPFSTLRVMFENPTTTTYLQLIGNILLLGWVGFVFYPLLARNPSLRGLGLTALITSASIETLQYILQNGRSSTMDDVILNTLGSVILFALARKTWVPLLQRLSIPEQQHPSSQRRR